MSDQVIAVTGANGFLGFHIVQQLVEAGITTRAIVRSPSSAERLHVVLRRYVDSSLLHFAFVPDITADEQVYDEAFHGVSAVIHTASPIFQPGQKTDDPEGQFYTPAIQGAVNAFKAAARYPSIKRVVLTSSVVTAYPDVPYGELSKDSLQHIDREAARKLTETNQAYRSSKKLSEKAVWDFIRQHKPHYVTTVLLPALLLGPPADPEAAQDSGSSGIYVHWAQNPGPLIEAKGSTTAADVRDTAKAHVVAALAQIPAPKLDNKRLFVVEQTVRAAQLAQKAREAVPQWTQAWDGATNALVDQAVMQEPDERARGYIVPSRNEDAEALGIVPMRDTLEVYADLLKAVAVSHAK